MADMLTIAGTPYAVMTSGATEQTSEYVGEKVRAFANNLRSTRMLTTKKRRWQFSLIMPEAAYTALRAATDADAVVSVGGAAVGAALDCMVEVTDAGYIRDGLSFMRVATITVEQV